MSKRSAYNLLEEGFPRTPEGRVRSYIWRALTRDPASTLQDVITIVNRGMGLAAAKNMMPTIRHAFAKARNAFGRQAAGSGENLKSHFDSEKITRQKLDSQSQSQFLDTGTMPDQRGTLRTILQGGITPFTNMRPKNILLGRSLKYRPRNPINQLVSGGGTVSVPFALRFHSDFSNERKNAVLVFRHNKPGIALSTTYYRVDSSTYTYSNSSGSDVSITYVSNVNAQIAADTDDLHPWQGTTTTETIPTGNTKTFDHGDYIPSDSPAYPTDTKAHKWGYADSVKVIPAQYNNNDPAYPKVGTTKMSGPFEEVEYDSSSKPQFYHCALNRSDLEDMSLQMQPMVMRRQGHDTSMTDRHLVSQSADASVFYQNGNPVPSWDQTFNSFSNYKIGWVPFSDEHSHVQESQLCKLNKLDDKPNLPKPGSILGKDNAGSDRALGTSFKYDAILKTGGVKYTMVNRGGSGCNVDVHIFKLKIKHIADHVTGVTWDELVKPYEDAYIKRAREIITADDLKGRVSDPTDVWTNAKFPLLPGSRHVNHEDEFLTRVEKTSCYIPSQGRKNVNIVFPGERYDPAAEQYDVDNQPQYDRFTYFALLSVTGEKSNAMFSSVGSLGTSLVSLADLFTTSSQAVVLPPSGVTVPYMPPVIDGWTASPSGNIEYDKWVLSHRYWGYSAEEYVFYSDFFISTDNKDVTGWVTSSLGPLPHIPDVVSGKMYIRRVRCPLPSLAEWLAANYDAAYVEQGRDWKPTHPKVFRGRWNMIAPTAYSRKRLLVSRVTVRSVEWPVYQSQAPADPVDPPVDVTPEFDDIQVEIPTVRTNFFSSFR